MLSFAQLLLSHFSVLVDGPEVHLSFGDVAESTNHEDVGVRTESDHVSESPTVLEVRVCLLAEIECRLSGLLS